MVPARILAGTLYRLVALYEVMISARENYVICYICRKFSRTFNSRIRNDLISSKTLFLTTSLKQNYIYKLGAQRCGFVKV